MDFNEWLLEDRMHVINDVIFKDKLNFKIIKTNNLTRDIALCKLFTMTADKYNAFELNDNNPVIITSVIDDSPNPICAEYDSNHILIKFNPLKVCNDEWIEWFIKKYIKGE